MKAEWINPFLFSLANAFETMLGCKVERGGLRLTEGSSDLYEISGMIGLSGDVAGMVVLSLARNVALKSASALLLTDAEQINEEVIDAVGELTNMVAGAAKSKLGEYQLSIGLPSVISGKGHYVRFPSNVTPIVVPYETEWGPLTLQVGLAAAAVPAGV